MPERIPKIGERVEVASRYVDKCESIIDIGCGTGLSAIFVRKKVGKLVGVDKSISYLEKAKRRGISIFKVDLDVDKLPFPDNTFNYALCLDVIEHIKDPIGLSLEVHRVLKKSGRLIISVPNIRFSDYIISLLIKGYFPVTSEDPEAYDGGHIHYFTFSNLREVLTKAGFIIEVEEGINNKRRRGLKGQILQKFLGEKFMREFRSPGILIVARKK